MTAHLSFLRAVHGASLRRAAGGGVQGNGWRRGEGRGRSGQRGDGSEPPGAKLTCRGPIAALSLAAAAAVSEKRDTYIASICC